MYFIYALDEEYKIRLSKTRNIDYLTYDLIYLLRVDNEDKSHYLYIKNINHFVNLNKHCCDKDKRFCPMCNNKVDLKEYNNHISKCINLLMNQHV